MYQQHIAAILSAAVVQATAAAYIPATTTIDASDFGVTPSNTDNCTAMQNLLAHIRQLKTPCVVQLAPGEYHFHAQTALPMQLFISNHDQQDVHPVGVPLVDLKNVTLQGKKTQFIFHGKMLPFVLMDCKGITIRNIRIDAAEPFSSEGRIVEIKDGKTTLKLSPASRYTVEGGKFLLTNNGRKDQIHCILAFMQPSSCPAIACASQRMPAGRGLPWARRSCCAATTARIPACCSTAPRTPH